MALVSKPYTFSPGATIVASEHNSNFDTIYNDYNGNITNANISNSAGIVDTKLGTITTAGKVDGSAIDNIDNLPSGAGNIPVANLGVSGTISGNKTFSGNILIGSANQGDVLYDNGTALTRLTPGTSGQVLKTQGAAANPTWATLIQGFNNAQAFTSNGTWTRPAGVDLVYVKVQGAGGGGGTNSGTFGGGGGGAGGYAEGYIAVSGNVTVTVGSGGTVPRGNGGNSSFAGDTTVTANGGSGGNSSGAGGAGGTASNGDINITGQAGGAGEATNGGYVGGGGNSFMGAGGSGKETQSRTGYGGGGKGALGTTYSGSGDGVGGDGIVLVYWAE